MNQHEYVTGFFGVLIGFTLTELIKGSAETLKNSGRVKYYFPHGLALILLFFNIILNFFDFNIILNWVENWTALLLIRYSFPTIFTCFFVYLIFPSFDGTEEVDFRKHYFKVFPIIFILLILLTVFTLVRNVLLFGHDLSDITIIFPLLILFAALSALLIKKDWVQYLFFALAIPLLVYWTLSYQLT
jgi:hypothetical protein